MDNPTERLRPQDLTRRSLLGAAGLGVAGGAATLGVTTLPKTQGMTEDPQGVREVRIRNTEHVRTYYMLARR